MSRGVLLAGLLALAAPSAFSGQSVDWTVTVSAHETYQTLDYSYTKKSVSFNTQGGVQGVPTAPGTVSFGVTLFFPGRTGCYPTSVAFSNVPHTGGTYSVWYAYLAPELHSVKLYRGGVGGELLGEETDTSYCPNGQKSLTADFEWRVQKTVTAIRSATTSGNLSGADGETLRAAWTAVPVAQAGGTLENHVPLLSGNNSFVDLVLEAAPSGTSGEVVATFPGGMCEGTVTCSVGACANTVPKCLNGRPNECVPLPSSEETCDSVDNDCDGQTDEDLGSSVCGVGVCAHPVPNCAYGHAGACEPLLGAGAEACDGLDNDCDGSADEDLGQLTCGVGACQATVRACVGGTVGACAPKPPSWERCGDGVDNDCDGVADEGCTRGHNRICRNHPNGKGCRHASRAAERRYQRGLNGRGGDGRDDRDDARDEKDAKGD